MTHIAAKLALVSLAGGALFFAYRTDNQIVDNAKIAVGLETEAETVSSSDKTIAATNNNPVNIRGGGDNWVGLANPKVVKGFYNFTKPEYCYRAAGITILKSYTARGVDTVSEIINTWAPPHENKTADYVKFVAGKMGVTPDTKVSSKNIVDLLYAMTIIESGKAISKSVIEKGLAL